MRAPFAALAAVALACTPDPQPAPDLAWSLVFHDLASGLVSVAGSSAKDVWTCGSDAGDGKGPLVLHFDGTGWKRLATGATGDLWWVHVFPDGSALLGGDGGKVLRYEHGAFTRQPTPGTRTVYGTWGATPDDAWAVGGSADDGTGFVWRWDGTAWKDFALPDGLGAKMSVFKVFGLSKSDVWLVGTAGHLLHWDGAALTDVNHEPTFTTSEKPLFTVHGVAGRIAAVGGFASGFILERDAAGTLHDASPKGLLGLSGVVLASADEGWAVGQRLAILHRTVAGWGRVDTRLTRNEDLHAVWLDPDGGVWTVGGDILSMPLSHGLLAHFGPPVPGGSFAE